MSSTYAAEIAAEYREDPAYHEDAPALCPLCRKPVGDEESAPDRPDTHDECYGQQIEETLLDADVERVADELAETLADYSRSRHAPAESARARIAVELLRGVVRVLRQMQVQA